ncbi:amidase [Pseudonocardia zijingensis]|uniref:Amidase n=1 Tax=Pseudonocardia zijingensis TaxID=153376 RepID=A0ABP4ABU9_9PSEU
MSTNFRDGTDTPRAYLERCLDVIAQREPQVRAWVVRNEEAARAAADASTERWRAGSPLSPVDGMPIGIKDLLETADMPTQMGCAAYAGNFPRHDNAAVWALRRAGAVILGKTVTAELGGTEPGPTTNPFDASRTPGGSSSGSAAAVGAGMVPATVGTQVVGSIIRPASYCGNWALKPSQGAINRGERQATSMSTHGVHATGPEDMWLTAMAMAAAGGDPGHAPLAGPVDTTPAPSRPHSVAVMETEGWDELDPKTREAFDQVLGRLEELGCPVLRRGGTPPLERFERSLTGAVDMAIRITAWENHWRLRGLIAEHPDGVSARGQETLRVAEELGVDGYVELLDRRRTLRARHASLAGVAEVLISPASPGPAPASSVDTPGRPRAPWPTGNPVFNAPSSVLGAPVVTVPLMTVDGLPVGVQVLGQPGADARVTAIARWLGDHVPPVCV